MTDRESMQTSLERLRIVSRLNVERDAEGRVWTQLFPLGTCRTGKRGIEYDTVISVDESPYVGFCGSFYYLDGNLVSFGFWE